MEFFFSEVTQIGILDQYVCMKYFFSRKNKMNEPDVRQNSSLVTDDGNGSNSKPNGPRAIQKGKGRVWVMYAIVLAPVGCIVISGMKCWQEHETMKCKSRQKLPQHGPASADQGTRRINTAVGVVILVFSGVKMFIWYYWTPKIRCRRRNVEALWFWFLVKLNLLSGCLFFAWAWRRKDYLRALLSFLIIVGCVVLLLTRRVISYRQKQKILKELHWETENIHEA